MNHKFLRILKWTVITLSILLIVAVGGFVYWANTPAEPMAEAQASLVSDQQVTVNEETWITFTPTGKEINSGLIIYPGGRVDPRAYAPTARSIAEQGYFVAIVPMPLNLAFFDVDAAADVIASYPEIEQWAIAGHSLGGSMAAQFAHDNPDLIDGLVLWASYPTESSTLAEYPIPVLSIYASEDGLATVDDIKQSESYLPPGTEWHLIEGGNHAQFGWYGAQDGDLPASISRQTQQEEIVNATVTLLSTLALQS